MELACTYKMPDNSPFSSLVSFLARVPAIDPAIGSGFLEDGNWWVKFAIDIDHPLAWNVVQELGHVLNYLSRNERLPAKFMPVSPPPYMNGGPRDFLSWVIESADQSLQPSDCAEWLEGRLPRPVDDPNDGILKMNERKGDRQAVGTPPMKKTRIDLLLVDRNLVPSRERARALILAGRVLVNEQKIDKPGASVDPGSAIRLLGEDMPYVSRGGIKLEAALDRWHIEVSGRACLDIGASTGGFTDCLLQRGAAHVTAVDTGFGQIAMKLRNDARVRLIERTNARFLARGAFAEAGMPALTLLVMDVSFISATLLLAPVFAAAPALTETVILVKPQFEAGRGNIGKGGIVRDPEVHKKAIEKVSAAVTELKWQAVETIPSPITGAEGNIEFLLYARRT